MTPTPYDRVLARLIRPLLNSIAREIHERSGWLAIMEYRIAMLAKARPQGSIEVLRLTEEVAIHQRELRVAYGEIERLGCTIVGESPLTFRIPTSDGGRARSLLWQVRRPLESENPV